MNSKKIVVIVIIVLFAMLAIGILPPGISIMTSVPAGHTGILVSYGNVKDTHLDSGLHWKKPWERVVTMDNRVQTLGIYSGTKNANTTDTAETKDQQLLPVFGFDIKYQLNEDMSYKVYEDYGVNYEDVLIKAKALQYIKETFAKYNADEIVNVKDIIPKEIKENLSEYANPCGIVIKDVILVTYDFSPEYTEILEERALLNAQLENSRLQQQQETIAAQTQYDVAVKQAQKDAETQRIAVENANEMELSKAENENKMSIAQAKAKAEADKINADNEAYKIRTNAEALRDAKIAEAEANAEEIKALAENLNEFVIEYKENEGFYKSWNGAMVPSFGGNTFKFADITDTIERYMDGDNNE